MGGYAFLFTALFSITLVFVLVKATGIALKLTGMDEGNALFQACSAYTSTGYTTSVAETVMVDELRRKIVAYAMILGHVGLVTIIITGCMTFMLSKGKHLPISIIIFVLSIIVILLVIFHTRWMLKLDNYIEKRLMRLPLFSKRGVHNINRFAQGYGLVKGYVTGDSSSVGRSLSDFKFEDIGSLVIGIRRGDTWISMPRAEEIIQPHDRIIAYGPVDKLKPLLGG